MIPKLNIKAFDIGTRIAIGQPTGSREVCLTFNNGAVTDYGYTAGGNQPVRFPYEINDRIVKYGKVEFEMSFGVLRQIVGDSNSIGHIYLRTPRSINEIHLPNTWLLRKVEENSIANEAQLKFLYQVILFEIHSKRSDEESFKIINANLKSMKLPEIESSANVDIISGTGAVGGSQGAKIIDQNHQYCLPCQIDRNQYIFCISNLSK